MKLDPIEQLVVHYEPDAGRRIQVGRLALKDRRILFEYDPGFIATGLALSPFHLPLRSGVFVGDPGVFHGLMGVFEDSLPDGWGRLLLDRKIARQGLSPMSLSPLDRLAWVGGRSMGALTYEPEMGLEEPTLVRLAQVEKDAQAVIQDSSAADLDRLIALGGSPQGARPKALVQLSADGRTLLYGAHAIRPGFTAYLVKFRAKGDDPHCGVLEHAYALMAHAAGLEVPETRILGRTRKHPGYFAARRFDRDGTQRVHLHTLSGLLQAPHTYPSLTYRELLLATRNLTRNEAAVAEMFRRACFNVFAQNRDDHSKNFAFLMDGRGVWRPSPAYDLTRSEGPGGEHAMLIGTEGRNPRASHLEALAHETGIKHASSIIGEVRAAVARFAEFADQAGLPKKVRNAVASELQTP